MRRCVYFCETYEVHVFYPDAFDFPETATLAEIELMGLHFEVLHIQNEHDN
jgi:hypothetical protein